MAQLVVSALRPVAQGIRRPEDVLRLPDGRVLASDSDSAVAEVLPAGGLRRIGSALGAPNGLGLLPDGRVVIANFELGCLQQLDLESGAIRVGADQTVDGRPLRHANYPLGDGTGGVWLSCCTCREDVASALAAPAADGMIAYVHADGTCERSADVVFPNCMAIDAGARYLYVCRTATSDVVRFPVLGPGKLGPEEPYGGALGGRQLHEVGDEFDLRTLEPSVLHRWGFADGCAFDVDGNLWVTLAMANRLVAITPSRTVVDVVIDGGDELLISPTSVAWAGDDLRDIYVGSLTSPYVLRGRSSVPGLSRY